VYTSTLFRFKNVPFDLVYRLSWLSFSFRLTARQMYRVVMQVDVRETPTDESSRSSIWLRRVQGRDEVSRRGSTHDSKHSTHSSTVVKGRANKVAVLDASSVLSVMSDIVTMSDITDNTLDACHRPVVYPVPTSARSAMAVSQHTVHPGQSIPVPTWTRLQAGESIPLQKWNSPRGGQVHYRCCCGGIK